MEVKETVELVDALQSFVDEVKSDTEDGKLTIVEILGNYPQVMAIIEEGKDHEAIVAELKDLDEEEIRTLADKMFGLIFGTLAIIKNLKK